MALHCTPSLPLSPLTTPCGGLPLVCYARHSLGHVVVDGAGSATVVDPDGRSIELELTMFDTEASRDWLEVYNGTDATDNLLLVWRGSGLKTADQLPIRIPMGKLALNSFWFAQICCGSVSDHASAWSSQVVPHAGGNACHTLQLLGVLLCSRRISK